MTEINSMLDFFGPVIHSFTRQQAIEDGYLVDVTETAKEAGFRFPVAVTSAVWNGRIVPGEKARKLGQDQDGRLWDVLWMLLNEIRRGQQGCIVIFKVIIQNNFKSALEDSNLVTLKAICGPGDNAEPVITIMEIDED